MAESDWDTVTVLRKKGPTAAQAKSKQVRAQRGPRGPGAAGRAGRTRGWGRGVGTGAGTGWERSGDGGRRRGGGRGQEWETGAGWGWKGPDGLRAVTQACGRGAGPLGGDRYIGTGGQRGEVSGVDLGAEMGDGAQIGGGSREGMGQGHGCLAPPPQGLLPASAGCRVPGQSAAACGAR